MHYLIVWCPDVIVSWPCLVSCSSSEIPQYRLPYDVVSFEVDLMKDLGVKVHVHDNCVVIVLCSTPYLSVLHDNHMTTVDVLIVLCYS